MARCRYAEPDGTKIEAWKVSKGPKEKLGMSRAFGDFAYKRSEVEGLGLWEQAVISKPTIVSRERSGADRWLVLACDGIWDVMGNAECGDFVDATYVRGRKKYLQTTHGRTTRAQP
jgi:serine/threonine protein phosphatase PrpC